MNVLVPLLESCQKRDFLRNGTIIHILGESMDRLQDSFFRAHSLSVSLRILGASPAFKPNVASQRGVETGRRNATSSQSARPLQQPGWALLPRRNLRAE